MTETDSKIEAAAEALWYDASKERFGPWGEVDEKVKDLWRKSAKAALQAADAAPPCVFEARTESGGCSITEPARAWCRVHGFDCPNNNPDY